MKSLTSSSRDRASDRHHRRSSRQFFLAEISIKLLVNGILIAAGLSTLIKLLPEHFSQSAKLREIRLTVERTQTRVDRARSQFKANFDPQRTQTIVEEQTPSIGRGQVPIFWLNETSTSRD